MGSSRYCRNCGHHINFQHGEEFGYCPICNKEITLADTITDYSKDKQVED